MITIYGCSTNGYVAADFYQNAAGDSSMCYAQMEVQTSNVGTKWSRVFDIRSQNGRYGPFLVNVNTQPASSGRAFNHVHVYNCAGNPHYIPTSPAVYYPYRVLAVRLDTIEKLCKALHFSVGELIEYHEEKKE